MMPASASQLQHGPAVGRATPARAFLAILRRDIFVAGKEFGTLLIHVALAPLFMLFIFGTVLGAMDYVAGAYGSVLLPGIIALSTFLTERLALNAHLTVDFDNDRAAGKENTDVSLTFGAEYDF